MSLRAKFHLQGVCSESTADSFYLLKAGGWFEGYIQSKLVYSEGLARWEIIDKISQQVVASLNYTSDYPLGLNTWTFTSSPTCTAGTCVCILQRIRPQGLLFEFHPTNLKHLIN